MTNTLEKIINDKKIKIEEYKNSLSISELEKKISEYKNYLNFKEKLKKNKISIITEIKKASPSAGVIVQNYNPEKIAQEYFKGGASCLSILTEKNFFQGELEHINLVKNKIKLPVLCKDFFIDVFQVFLAKAAGADAILIILSAVNQITAKKIYDSANELNLDTIVEVHTEDEAKKALNFEKSIIGINNRNLKTLQTNISTTFTLFEILKNHSQPLVCESGIKTKNEINEIVKKTKINNFLIGESLLKSNNIASKLKEFTQIVL